jgi:hypoxanthine phosphoribosyltransferase
LEPVDQREEKKVADIPEGANREVALIAVSWEIVKKANSIPSRMNSTSADGMAKEFIVTFNKISSETKTESSSVGTFPV